MRPTDTRRFSKAGAADSAADGIIIHPRQGTRMAELWQAAGQSRHTSKGQHETEQSKPAKNIRSPRHSVGWRLPSDRPRKRPPGNEDSNARTAADYAVAQFDKRFPVQPAQPQTKP